MTELKPCPFCGSQHVKAVYDYTYVWKVVCSCGSQGPFSSNRETAIDDWNRREK